MELATFSDSGRDIFLGDISGGEPASLNVRFLFTFSFCNLDVVSPLNERWGLLVSECGRCICDSLRESSSSLLPFNIVELRDESDVEEDLDIAHFARVCHASLPERDFWTDELELLLSVEGMNGRAAMSVNVTVPERCGGTRLKKTGWRNFQQHAYTATVVTV